MTEPNGPTSLDAQVLLAYVERWRGELAELLAATATTAPYHDPSCCAAQADLLNAARVSRDGWKSDAESYRREHEQAREAFPEEIDPEQSLPEMVRQLVYQLTAARDELPELIAQELERTFMAGAPIPEWAIAGGRPMAVSIQAWAAKIARDFKPT
jgi:hypothetical protein